MRVGAKNDMSVLCGDTTMSIMYLIKQMESTSQRVRKTGKSNVCDFQQRRIMKRRRVEVEAEAEAGVEAEAEAEVEDKDTDDDRECKRVWRNIEPIFKTLQHAHLDGSVFATRAQLLAYKAVTKYIASRMRRVNIHAPACWKGTVFVLQTLIVQDTGIPSATLSPAIVAAALWEADMCDKSAWMMARSSKAMFVAAEFYADERRFRNALATPWLSAAVPAKFKHRLAAAVSVIVHATQNMRLQYTVSGMDFLLPATFSYYEALQRDIMRAGGTTSDLAAHKPYVTVAEWCASTDFFGNGRLARALALDRDDNFQLQDVQFRKTDTRQQYAWLPAVAFYLTDMETSTASIVATPLLEVLKTIQHWDDFCILKI